MDSDDEEIVGEGDDDENDEDGGNDLTARYGIIGPNL